MVDLIGGRTRTRTWDPLIKSQRLKIKPKRAIRLSRKDWHSRANRAVLSPVPDDECVPGSCPAGLKAEVGLRWCDAMPPESEWRIPMPKLAEKQATKFVAARAVTTQPSQPPKATSSNDQGGRLSKQARVVEMLHSPTGTTVAAVMKTTGWQQHSVRGFFAGVVQKKLRLKLNSKKINGNRIYRIVSASSDRSSSRRASRRPT
jgi:hypothetical protein